MFQLQFSPCLPQAENRPYRGEIVYLKKGFLHQEKPLVLAMVPVLTTSRDLVVNQALLDEKVPGNIFRVFFIDGCTQVEFNLGFQVQK